MHISTGVTIKSGFKKCCLVCLSQLLLGMRLKSFSPKAKVFVDIHKKVTLKALDFRNVTKLLMDSKAI